MIDIEDIEHKLRSMFYLGKFGQKMPEFAFVSPSVISFIFYEGISAGHIPNSHYGFSGFAIWTSIGRLELVPWNDLSDEEVIFSFSKNMLLHIFLKLGLDDGKNFIYW